MLTLITNSRWFERLYPYLSAGLITLACFKFDIYPNDKTLNDLLSALLSASSIAVGFLTAAISILLPISTTLVGQQLVRKNLKKDIVNYLCSAIYSCLILAGLCIVGFFLKEGFQTKLYYLLIIFFSVLSGLCLTRVANILLKVFSRASEPEDKQG